MKTYTFKTDMHCENCIRTVSPVLNREIEIETWKVDLGAGNALLTIESDLEADILIKLVAQAGFQAELVTE